MRILALDRLDQVLMLVDHARKALVAIAVTLEKGGEEQPVAVDDRERAGIAGRVVDRRVEFAIGMRNTWKIPALDARLEALGGAMQSRKVRRRPAFGCAAREHRLDRAAHVEHVLDEAAVDRPHACAAVRLDHDEAFAVQHAQRFAHRHVADAVAQCEILDAKAGTERQVARYDVVAQPLLDVGERRIGRRKARGRASHAGQGTRCTPARASHARSIEPGVSSAA